MKIAIIGCGVMGSMLARHLALSHTVFLYDRNSEKAHKLAEEVQAIFYPDLQKIISQSDKVILAIKPKDLFDFATQYGRFFLSSHIIISILAGISLQTLQDYFSLPLMIRAMPNLALSCGQGVMGLCSDSSVPSQIKDSVGQLFAQQGLTMWVAEEKLDALSVAAGSSPAFIFVMIEAMIDSGILLGLSYQESKALALQSLAGSLELLKGSDVTPGQLKWQITSAGGSTISGLKALETSGVRGAIMQTYLSAYEKVNQMSGKNAAQGQELG